MSLLFYKVLHILGLALLFTGLGALVSTAGKGDSRRLLLSLHGIGMLAKLGGGFPGWVDAKLLIWLFLGAALALVKRMPQLATVWWLLFPLLGTLAGYLALYQPF